MGQLGLYYFNGNSFAQATSVFTDSDLTTLAPDGYYSNAGIVRQQLLGILLSPETCSTCCVPCNALVSVSESTNGLYSSCLELGGGTGAVIFRIQTIFQETPYRPVGTIITHNGSNYNRFTCKNNHFGITLVDYSNGVASPPVAVDYAGLNNQPPTTPTYVGGEPSTVTFIKNYNQTPSDPCADGDQLENYTYSAGSFVEQGTYQTVEVTDNEVGYVTSSGGVGPTVFTLVFPKTNAGSSLADILNYAPMCTTGMVWEAECPAQLPSFQALPGFNSIPNCPTIPPPLLTFYFARNAVPGTFPSLEFVVDTNTTPDVGNFVFEDANGSVYLNDTGSETFYLYLEPGNYIKVRNGVVVEKGLCQPVP